MALAVFDTPERKRILAYISLLPLPETTIIDVLTVMFLAPLENLAPNAYALNLKRPGASRFVRYFQQCIQQKQ